MLKKMKRVAMDSSPSYMVDEEARARFKHQSLMQDYQELFKDTQAIKNQLQRTKQKRSTLKAEVRFLRRRYKHLLAVQSPSTQAEPDRSRLMNHGIGGEPLADKRNCGEKEAAQLPNHSVSERRVYREKEAAQLPNHPVSEKRIYREKEAAQLPNHLVSEKRSYRVKEAAQLPNHKVFDLNQVSREDEEEFQVLAPVGMEKPPNNYLGLIGRRDEQPTDLNLPVCRDIGNGSSRPGKRKITWSDQVALRV